MLHLNKTYIKVKFRQCSVNNYIPRIITSQAQYPSIMIKFINESIRIMQKKSSFVTQEIIFTKTTTSKYHRKSCVLTIYLIILLNYTMIKLKIKELFKYEKQCENRHTKKLTTNNVRKFLLTNIFYTYNKGQVCVELQTILYLRIS